MRSPTVRLGGGWFHLVQLIAQDGMVVESETQEVRRVRRAALELLLSDHAGECRAPCQYACPFHTDVPQLIRQIAAGRPDEAIVTLRAAMPLPAVLARVGSEACEGACRRCVADESASIGLLKRYVADFDLARPTPYVPPCRPASGKRVAMVGAGPCGLSAAYFLLQRGHACTLIDAREHSGGMLCDLPPAALPPKVLAAEITLIEQLGAEFELNTTIGQQRTLADLRRDHDAVLLAVGQLGANVGKLFGLPVVAGRLQVQGATHETGMPGVFAAGDAVRPWANATRAAADGKSAAVCIDQMLRGEPVTGPTKLVALGTVRPRPDEVAALAADAGSRERVAPSSPDGFTDEEARAEARRCLHCDCHKLGKCALQKYAMLYDANAHRYRGRRRPYERPLLHPDVIYEPGKCILCGLCIQVAQQAGEPLGLTLVGRGFDARVEVPFEESLAAALQTAARRCAEVCPTGALSLREDAPREGETPAEP